jgi:pyruvate dehydrogenase E1 component alpha subunit
MARNHTVQTGRPLILEMKTYRYRGHSMSDPAKYRTKEEVEKYKSLDPIAKIKSYIFEKNLLSEDDCDRIESKIFKEMSILAEECIKSPEPSEKELYTDVYCERKD